MSQASTVSRKVPLALQLYSVREDCARDLPGVLKQVAAMGYQGVEFAGYYNYSAADLRRMLDDNGLRCAGTHTGIQTLLGDELEKTAAFNRELGNPFLIVPGLPEPYRVNAAAWASTAETFNAIAERLRPLGCKTGYHNHSIEFTPMEGQCPWDIFFSRTRPEVVMQVDSGNARHGGADVIPFIERYPGRALTVHAKEWAADNRPAAVGEGDIAWDRFFAVCETVGATQWYIVEQEVYGCPPMECVRKCLENLRRMGK